MRGIPGRGGGLALAPNRWPADTNKERKNAKIRRDYYEVRDSNFGDPVFWVFGLSDTAVCAHLEKHAAKQANQNTSVNNRPPSNYHK